MNYGKFGFCSRFYSQKGSLLDFFYHEIKLIHRQWFARIMSNILTRNTITYTDNRGESKNNFFRNRINSSTGFMNSFFNSLGDTSHIHYRPILDTSFILANTRESFHLDFSIINMVESATNSI